MGGNRAARHGDQAEVEHDPPGVLAEDAGERAGRRDRLELLAEQVLARIHPRDRHGDDDQRGDQGEGEEHRHSQVPSGQRFVLLAPPFGQQGVGVEEGHVDADRRAEHAQHQGDVLGVGDLGNPVPADEPLAQLGPVDLGNTAYDDDGEHEDDQRDHRAQEPFVELDAPGAASVAEHGEDVDRQDDGADQKAQSDPAPGEYAGTDGLGPFDGVLLVRLGLLDRLGPLVLADARLDLGAVSALEIRSH